MMTTEMETRITPEVKRKGSKKKKVILIIVITLVSLLVLSGGALALVGVSASNGDTIFPNVRVSGVAVGGLTLDQAAERLVEPMADDQTNRAVTVTFPNGGSVDIPAQDAGLVVTGYQAARLAYNYGRSGNIFSNSIAFLRAQFVTVNIDPLTLFVADQDMLRETVIAVEEELDLRSQHNFEIVDDRLILTQGMPMVSFNEDRLIALITDAFLDGAHTPVDYHEAMVTDPEPLDLDVVYEAVFAAPEDAVFDIETEEVSAHVMGISFDRALAAQMLQTAEPGAEVAIPLTFTPPERTTEFMQEVLFRDLLASSTTSLTGDENRNTNIALASSFIHEMVLNPGDQFDFNTVVGQRTAERGFRPGGAFSGTRIIQTIGGGICQVSSTIYHALLHTEIQIDTRRNHTLVVTYLPLGMDAAVAWDALDFAFTNSLDFPIRIITYREGSQFHVRIYGTNTSDYYRIEPEGVYIGSVGYSTTYRNDPSIPTGTTSVYTAGRVGHIVEVFQRFYDENGNLVRREFVSRDNYHPVPRVVNRGTGAAAAPPPAAPAPEPPAE